jgi:hypothetical protein
MALLEVPAMSSRILLVGCVSRKASSPMPARDLYTSELFRRRRAFAERSGHPWLILSALHGLVSPNVVLEPYDVTLKRMSRQERASWGNRVVEQLGARFASRRGVVFEIHAGDEYAGAIEVPLRRLGADIARPLKGLRIGEQLRWYARQVGIQEGR